MSHAIAPVALGGRLVTPTRFLIALVAAAGVAAMAFRFAAGLGASTALSEGYPFGLWIFLDVVGGTSVACGGYALALLVYVQNRGHYHPLVRPAVVASALGYTLAGLSVALDVGRPWALPFVLIRVGDWNPSSALLEVALCITTYIFVLWIELAPAILERWKNHSGALGGLSRTLTPVLERLLVPLLALGMVLPTLHQSALGTLMLLSGPRLHAIWNTPLLPIFFLLTCLSMGFAAVVFEEVIAALAFHRPMEQRLLAGLGRRVAPVSLVFLALRFGDLAYRGKLGLVLEPTGVALAFWIESALYALGALLLHSRRGSWDKGWLLLAAFVLLCGGLALRFDTYMIAFQPGARWSYFPTVTEIAVSLGLIAIEILAFVLIVQWFPILAGSEPAKARS